jgi:hypothetical protein
MKNDVEREEGETFSLKSLVLITLFNRSCTENHLSAE